jgi:probable F420-dependent oxidoreductase
MKLALFGLHRDESATDPDVLTRRARLAEEVGFESLWVGDHILLPPGPGDQPRLEVVTVLTYLAAVTSRVRLAAGVFVLPQRQPVLFAKQLASLDVLSGGRLIIGVGAGYVEDELSAMGVPLSERGARTDEYLGAMSALWASRDFAGKFVSFTGIQRPLPVQQPYPPIVVGGEAPSALRRAVLHGNGWYGWNLDVDQTAAALAKLRSAIAQVERPAPLGALEITITPRDSLTVDLVRRYADLGVDRLVVQPPDKTAMDGLITSTGDLIGRL